MSSLDETLKLVQVSSLGGNLLKAQVHSFIRRRYVDRPDQQPFDFQLSQTVDLLFQA